MPKTKCHKCGKKIPVVMRGIPCLCGDEFCAVHRLPETHNCGFDHRYEHLKNAATLINDMKCVGEKIKKI